MDKGNLLITGASGFIGSHMSKYFISNGWEVTGIEHDSRRIDIPSLLGIRDKMNWCRLDIGRDSSGVKRVIADYEIDSVIHLAALPIVRAGARTTLPIYETNIFGTLHVLEAIKEQNLSGFTTKGIMTATDKVYGNYEWGKPYTEDLPLNADDVYSSSKACADIITRAFSRLWKLPLVTTRPSNIYGPADLNSRLIPNTIKNCLRSRPPIIYEGINYVREFTYIDDLSRAYEILLNKLDVGDVSSEAYNIGSGKTFNQETCIREILRHFSELKPEYRKPMKYMGNEIEYQELNSDKMRRLGWIPKVSFSDGIKSTIKWYKENIDILP